MIRPCGIRFAIFRTVIKTLFLTLISILFFFTSALAQTVIRDEYWGGGTAKVQKDTLGPASEITQMEVVVDDETITVTISGPFFYNYIHHIKGAHKTPPGDLYISSVGWKVKGTAPYAQDTFTKDEGWDYVVSLFDKAVYKLDWSKIEWSRPKPGSVIYRRDQAWRGGYGGFVSWADIKLTDKSLVISFPLNALLQEIIPSSDNVADDTDEGESNQSANLLDLGLHWTMMCANDVVEGGFAVPVEIFSDYEEGEEFPVPRPATWSPTKPPPLVPWYNNPKAGTILIPLFYSHGDSDDNGHSVPEPSTVLFALAGLSAVSLTAWRTKKKP